MFNPVRRLLDFFLKKVKYENLMGAEEFIIKQNVPSLLGSIKQREEALNIEVAKYELSQYKKTLGL